tara:strand:+ start:999 stop:2363 length:1365 start_codon:yes stop_codon:yes gene_type:complete
MSNKKEIVIIGGGLVGPILSLFLAKRNYSSTIIESRNDIRLNEISNGRSINLAITERGLHALKQVGIKQSILNEAIPLRGRLIHNTDGKTTFQKYGQKKNQVIYSISRSKLNKILLSSSEETGKVKIFFNEQCLDADLISGKIKHKSKLNGKISIRSASHIFATDGSKSIIRKKMTGMNGFEEKVEILEHGYKELIIPPTYDGDYRLDSNMLHIWPREKFMLIALPNFDGSFTCTLFLPKKGPISFLSLKSGQNFLKFFKNVFPDLIPVMKDFENQFINKPTGNLYTINCQPWNIKDKFLLLGDAAHTIAPFFGQGINAAFEDCTIFDSLLKKYDNEWEKVFSQLSQNRKPEMDAISEMAIENYYEMRNETMDPKFLIKKEVEFILERNFPNQFIPRYSMVVFNRIPYTICQKRSKIQEKILKKLCANIKNVNQIDLNFAEILINKKLDKIRFI